jgi:hypothetical protein
MTITDWIHSKRDFKIGVELYQKAKGNTALLALFNAGENSFSKRKLLEALSEINFPAVEELHPPIQLVQTENKKEPKPKFIPSNLHPDPVKAIHSLRLDSFKKMSALHQTICNIEGNGPKAQDKRFALMQQIKELDKTNQECWAKLEFFAANGNLPEDPNQFNPSELTIRELVNLEKAIPTYISKEKKKLEQPGLELEKIDKINASIFQWKLELAQVSELLNKLPKINQLLC